MRRAELSTDLGKAVMPAESPLVSVEPMMQFFDYQHLPPHLREISAKFFDLATDLVVTLPRNPERSAMLRKLLEAKDCAVRARLYA
jgi:hypothetical protein